MTRNQEKQALRTTEEAEASAPDLRIAAGKAPAHGARPKPAADARTQPSSGLHDVVAEPSARNTGDGSMFPVVNTPDRRRQVRDGADRRRSARWEMNKALLWRPFRGRRIRESRVILRSLDGLVLLADRRDSLPPGARIILGVSAANDRFEFRSAVVKRTKSWHGDKRLIFAEIEA
jgi:hypothetical protein